jgi:rubrerythrin
LALDANLRPFEVLAVAIRSEIEAANFYSRLLNRVKNILLEQKLEFLVLEEKKHKKILEKLYTERFPDHELKVPEKSDGPRLPVIRDKQSPILDLFKAALKAEKFAEEFYRDARNKTGDTGSKRMLEYLSRVERSHYFLIKAEIDLLSRFPDYYDVEDFHLGQDLFHVGP